MSWSASSRCSARMMLIIALALMLYVAPKAHGDDVVEGDADTVSDAAPPPDVAAPPEAPATDLSASNQVLEIPQQCDQDAVAVLCDRSIDTSPTSDDALEDVANDPGTLYDYANQNIVSDASGVGTTNLPMGMWVPAYTRLSPAPTVVSPPLPGPGGYQQWASGPGTYRSIAPGPGFIAPMPLGYHPYPMGGGFAAHSIGGLGGGHFGRR